MRRLVESREFWQLISGSTASISVASLVFSIEPITYLLTLKVLEPYADRLSKLALSALGLALIGISLPLLTAGGRIWIVVNAGRRSN